GAAKANAVMVSVNWRLAPPEVLHIVNDAEAEILFVGEEYFPVIEKICDELTTVRKIVALGGRHPSWESFEAWRDRQAPDDPRLAARPEDTAIQFYTSGTTGLPKRAAEGRCEGRKPAPVEVVAEARRLARKSPKTGQRRSLRAIASELASLGHVGPRVVRIMRAVCAICSPVDAGLLAIWAIELCANVSKDNPHELIPLLASTG
ncbi:MAG: AMP-binding protein, partial [Hyphomicrobiales bacterium]